MADEVPALSLPAFSKRDCALLSSFPAKKPNFNKIPAPQQEHLRDLRARLERLAMIGANRYSGTVRMTSAVSSLNPNGRVSKSYWACIFPRQEDASRTSKSFSLQLALSISPAGAEILLCLGMAKTQETNLEAKRSNNQKLLAVREGSPSSRTARSRASRGASRRSGTFASSG